MTLIALQALLLVLGCQQAVMGLSLPSPQLNPALNATLHSLDNRDAKFLAPYITIRNMSCNSLIFTACLTWQDCKLRGGSASGLCLLGLGVCCNVNATVTTTTTTAAPPTVDDACGRTVTASSTRFTNPGYPTSYSKPGTCKLSIGRISNNICQLKINFIQFQLAQPNNDGVCVTDYFKVSGSLNDNNIPKLCGDNNGRHVYVDVDRAVGSPILSMFLGNTNSLRSWDINVTQICCNDTSRAPSGCRQYYTGQSGTIESFNFNRGLTAIDNANTHLAQMNYGACIESADYCKIIYKRTGDSKYSFLMTKDPAEYNFDEAAEDILVNLIQTGSDCNTDYVGIPQASYSKVGTVAPLTADRFCGLSFPSEVTSTAAPFVVHVKTNDKEAIDEDQSNNGFSLDYVLSEEC